MHALFAFLALVLGSANVYRWVDADGQAHYTDRPQPGAEQITITVSPPASSPANGAAPDASTQATDNAKPAPVPRYESLTITSPAGDQVLWNIEGQVEVEAAVTPELQPGHVLRFYLDGRMALAEPGASRTLFSEVFRGEHSLRVEVADEAGRTLVSSPTSQFFVRQTAVPRANP